MSVSKGDEAIRLDAGLDQLAESRDAEAGGQVLVANAAAQGGGDADHEVELVFLGELGPAGDDVAVVLWRLGQRGGVVNAVVVEEHATDLVALFQRGLAEQVGGIAGLMLVGPFVDGDCNLHEKAFLRNGCGSRRSDWHANHASRRSGTW